MEIKARRQFLKGVGAVVGGTSLVSLTPLEARAASGGTDPVAGFGFELSNVQNQGATVYFKANNPMTVNSIDLDMSYTIKNAPASAGLATVSFFGGVSRGGPPSFNSGGGFSLPSSTDFGSIADYNPNNTTITFNGALAQSELLAVVLKSWVPTTGAGSAAYRHVTAQPALAINAGDYFAFSISGGGPVPLDAEIQVIIAYTVT